VDAATSARRQASPRRDDEQLTKWTKRSKATCARLASICDLCRSSLAWGDSRRDRCPGRQRGGATCCGAFPAARTAGRLRRTWASTGPVVASLVLGGPSLYRSPTWMGERGQRGGRSNRSIAGPLGSCAGPRRYWEAGRWFPWFTQVSGLGAGPSGCLTRWLEDAWAMWCAPLVVLLWAAHLMPLSGTISLVTALTALRGPHPALSRSTER
jgi:hypothetical protein